MLKINKTDTEKIVKSCTNKRHSIELIEKVICVLSVTERIAYVQDKIYTMNA
jgi:hypothetical protein